MLLASLDRGLTGTAKSSNDSTAARVGGYVGEAPVSHRATTAVFRSHNQLRSKGYNQMCDRLEYVIDRSITVQAMIPLVRPQPSFHFRTNSGFCECSMSNRLTAAKQETNYPPPTPAPVLPFLVYQLDLSPLIKPRGLTTTSPAKIHPHT